MYICTQIMLVGVRAKLILTVNVSITGPFAGSCQYLMLSVSLTVGPSTPSLISAEVKLVCTFDFGLQVLQL